MKKVSKLILLFFVMLSSVGLALPPKVVVTIKPIDSLVVGIMENVGSPSLLLPDFASPHTYALRPSDARLLKDAEVVIWVGAELETFLEKPLQSLSQQARKVSLLTLPHITLYPYRSKSKGHQASETNLEHPAHQGLDPHIWLSVENARHIVIGISKILQEMDPENALSYQKNTKSVLARLDNLDKELAQIVEPVHSQPFLVFHDGYQYFEKAYRLNSLGSINANPGSPLSAKGLKAAQDKIKENNIQCLFTELEFSEVKLTVFQEMKTVHLGVLDPLGALQPTGKDAYFNLMRKMAKSLSGCLQTQSS